MASHVGFPAKTRAERVKTAASRCRASSRGGGALRCWGGKCHACTEVPVPIQPDTGGAGRCVPLMVTVAPRVVAPCYVSMLLLCCVLLQGCAVGRGCAVQQHLPGCRRAGRDGRHGGAWMVTLWSLLTYLLRAACTSMVSLPRHTAGWLVAGPGRPMPSWKFCRGHPVCHARFVVPGHGHLLTCRCLPCWSGPLCRPP